MEVGCESESKHCILEAFGYANRRERIPGC